MAAGDGFQLFEQRMADKQDPKAQAGGILDILLQLLPVLIPLIAGCFGSGRVNRKPIRLGNRARVAVELAAADRLLVGDRIQTADQAFDVMDEASMDEFRAFVGDCCSAK